jgi:hypothetical protein
MQIVGSELARDSEGKIARPSTPLGTLTHSTPLRVILSISNG